MQDTTGENLFNVTPTAGGQTEKPQAIQPYTLEIYDAETLVDSTAFNLESKRGLVARSHWLNVSARENLKFTVKTPRGEQLTVKLSDSLKAIERSDNFTTTVQGTQGHGGACNLAFTVFVNTKKKRSKP